MESLIVKKYLSLLFCKSNNLILFFAFVVISSNQAQAFFESKAKYDLENHWFILLSDNSPKNRFKAMRAFLLYPEWGLPVLRNSIKASRIEKNSWEIGALIGTIGDSSDVPYLLKFWRKFQGEKKAEVFLGAIERIYRKQRNFQIVKPKLSNLSVKFIGNELFSNTEGKNAIIQYLIKNPADTYIFIRVESHFWGTSSNENIPSEYFWLKSGEQIESKVKTNLIPNGSSNNIRLDFRIFEVGSSDYLLHETLFLSM